MSTPPKPNPKPKGESFKLLPDASEAGAFAGLNADAEAQARVQRGSVVDRRMIPNRREFTDPTKESPAEDASTLDRRRGPGRRLSDFTKSAEEGQMTKEQFLFLMAIDEFKRANKRNYPTWTDVLEVIRLLGYRKTMPSELTLQRAEDWLEAPNTPAGVRAPRWHERAA